MAFTTPRTWVAGEIATAANLNTNVRDNIAWQATDSPACRAYKSTAFSHNSSGNWLGVTMDLERFDNAAVHSTSSNTDRLTIPTGGGGKYIAGGCLQWNANGSGVRGAGLGVNGLTTFAVLSGIPAAGDASNAITVECVTVYSMSAADYFDCGAYQNSGGTLAAASTANTSPEFWMFFFRT